MEKAEYDATVGAGKPVHSTGAYSHHSEGTNFSDDPGTAEGYVNYGRSDPRVTGEPTYLVGALFTEGMKRERDGYIKSKKPVPLTRLAEVWEMRPENGEIVGYKLPLKRRNSRSTWDAPSRSGSTVQSILFDRSVWGVREAKRWLREHDFKAPNVDRKPNVFRFRQHNPSLFHKDSFRTIPFGENTGIQAIVAIPR